jgi:PEP-CTERM motif
MRSFLPLVLRDLSVSFVALVALVTFTPSSQAAYIVPSAGPLIPGGASVAPPLTTAAAGTLQASLLAPWTFTTTAGTTSGSILSAVYLNPTGTLDFYYQVFNSAVSVTALAHESDTSFLGFPSTVAFRLDGGSLPSNPGFVNGGSVPVSSKLDASGTTVDFSFVPVPPGTAIPKGTTSGVLIISTLATSYTRGNAEVIDGGTATVNAFQPLVTPSIPEPASLVLIGGGLLVLVGIRRMRR